MPIDIPLKDKVSGIKNWEYTIFASPNINYALDYRYCDNIKMNDPYTINYKCIVEVRIKPNTFTKHKSKIIDKHFTHHAFREEKTEIDDIFRISSEKNIFVSHIIFIEEGSYFMHSSRETLFSSSKGAETIKNIIEGYHVEKYIDIK